MSEPSPNVVAERFAVFSGVTDCFKCECETPVAAIVVADHHEGPEPFDDDDSDSEIEATSDPALLGNITWLNPSALQVMKDLAPWMAWIESATAEQVYLGNGCIHCGALQGDWFLRKPEGPCFPMTNEDADRLGVSWQQVPLRAVASCGHSTWIDALLERRGDYITPAYQRRGKRTAGV